MFGNIYIKQNHTIFILVMYQNNGTSNLTYKHLYKNNLSYLTNLIKYSYELIQNILISEH
jgi:hypothetical protein